MQVILKFKPPYEGTEETLKLMAEYALATFGEGGNPEARQVEDYIGEVNTPPQGGYIRLQVPEYYAQALEYIEANGGSEYAELIWVGWPGSEEPVIEWTNEDGSVQQLGRFA